MSWIIDRLKEPTTKAAIGTAIGAAVAALFGQISPEAAIVTALGLLIPALVPEGAKPIVADIAQAIAGGAKKSAPLIALVAGLSLSACAGIFGPTDATDTRSPQQVAFDDACWSVKTAEATFTAFNARGAVDAAGVAQFQTISAELDAACGGPIPTDMKQFAAKALISAASIVSLAVPKAASTAAPAA